MRPLYFFPDALFWHAVDFPILGWLAYPMLLLERGLSEARRWCSFFLIDWNRRVDPVWVVEMISGGTAAWFALWMIFGSPGPTRRIETSIPGVLWFVAMCILAVYQCYCAIAAGRTHRAAGCVAGAVMWSVLLIIILLRAGFSGASPPLIMLDFACVCACLAYYVSPQRSDQR